jgi:hypothetical protein
MKIYRAGTALAAALLFSGLCVQPALAHTGGGGGGHSGGSGGHAFAGGHAGGGGGGHYATQHYAAHGGGYGGYAGGRATGYGGGAHTAVAARGAVGYGGRGFERGGYGGYGGARWGGGYWGGRFWPGVYYGAGFAWFLPVLPLYCSTFWWNSVPYYYYNDAYYTWSPTADGYVATDPPPAATSGDAQPGAPSDSPSATYGGAGPGNDATAPQGPSSAPAGGGGGGGGDNVFAYPAKGQSEAQQATDRMQCDQWASSQTGGAAGSPDFRRAVIACYNGRGYSAQ